MADALLIFKPDSAHRLAPDRRGRGGQVVAVDRPGERTRRAGDDLRPRGPHLPPALAGDPDQRRPPRRAGDAGGEAPAARGVRARGRRVRSAQPGGARGLYLDSRGGSEPTSGAPPAAERTSTTLSKSSELGTTTRAPSAARRKVTRSRTSVTVPVSR